MELLAQASRWLQSTHQASNSRSVILLVPGGTPVPVAARIGRTEFDVYSADGGFLSKWESRDFLIAAADLAAAGIAEPPRGTLIQETDPTTGQIATYEAAAPEGEQHAPFDDRFRQTFRIHTRNVTPPAGNA